MASRSDREPPPGEDSVIPCQFEEHSFERIRVWSPARIASNSSFAALGLAKARMRNVAIENDSHGAGVKFGARFEWLQGERLQAPHRRRLNTDDRSHPETCAASLSLLPLWRRGCFWLERTKANGFSLQDLSPPGFARSPIFAPEIMPQPSGSSTIHPSVQANFAEMAFWINCIPNRPAKQNAQGILLLRR